jgi:hypothetical protein
LLITRRADLADWITIEVGATIMIIRKMIRAYKNLFRSTKASTNMGFSCVAGHPVLWVPKWLGLLLFPFLQFVIPYIIYQVACRDPDLKIQR